VSNQKQQVYKLCQHYIRQRIQTIQQAMDEAQASANEETKSSAGDKYETGRAMMQLELEKNAAQLAEANKLQVTLNHLDPLKVSNIVQVGSLVTTTIGLFYIGISAGPLKLDDKIIFAVSAASPVGMKLIGLKQGDTFQQQGKLCTILAVD